MRRAIVGLFLVGMISAATVAAANAQMVGAYGSIPTNNPDVVKAAHFAVRKKHVKLASIEAAESQVVSGTNYRLCLYVGHGKAKRYAYAVVYENLRSHYSLTSWEYVKQCSMTPAAFLPGDTSQDGSALAALDVPVDPSEGILWMADTDLLLTDN